MTERLFVVCSQPGYILPDKSDTRLFSNIPVNLALCNTFIAPAHETKAPYTIQFVHPSDFSVVWRYNTKEQRDTDYNRLVNKYAYNLGASRVPEEPINPVIPTTKG